MPRGRREVAISEARGPATSFANAIASSVLPGRIGNANATESIYRLLLHQDGGAQFARRRPDAWAPAGYASTPAGASASGASPEASGPAGGGRRIPPAAAPVREALDRPG